MTQLKINLRREEINQNIFWKKKKKTLFFYLSMQNESHFFLLFSLIDCFALRFRIWICIFIYLFFSFHFSLFASFRFTRWVNSGEWIIVVWVLKMNDLLNGIVRWLSLSHFVFWILQFLAQTIAIDKSSENKLNRADGIKVVNELEHWVCVCFFFFSISDSEIQSWWKIYGRIIFSGFFVLNHPHSRKIVLKMAFTNLHLLSFFRFSVISLRMKNAFDFILFLSCIGRYGYRYIVGLTFETYPPVE